MNALRWILLVAIAVLCFLAALLASDIRHQYDVHFLKRNCVTEDAEGRPCND